MFETETNEAGRRPGPSFGRWEIFRTTPPLNQATNPLSPPRLDTLQVGTIRMQIATQGSGPLVVLCHGFPELWFSWRAQLAALAAAGYRAVAPDMRGYGGTDAPSDIEAYTMLHLVGDMVGLVKALGETQALIVGHDWGAPVAWNAALMSPDIFRAVAGMSVPFAARGPTELLAALHSRTRCPAG